MRILLVTPYYKPYLGGVERVVENLTREFMTSGHEVAVLTSKYSFPRTYHREWVDQETVDGVVVNRLNCWPKNPLPFFSAPLTWFSPKEIGQIVKTHRPEMVVYLTDKWFLVNFLVRLFTGRMGSVRQVWCPVFHDLTLLKQWLRPINWLFGCMINDVVVVTKLEAEKVRQAYGVGLAKIKVIPWGVSVGAYGNTPLRHGEAVILCVGRISRHKGQKWLTDRFREAAAKTSVPCQLVLVGEVEEPVVVEEIRSLRDPRIVIDTVADDGKLAEYYRQADIFALFPQYESFGLVFLEAMSYGVPVLTHDVGAIKEVLGEAAEVVEKYDEKAAVTSLLHLINNMGYRKELGLANQKFVQEKYSWKKCADEILRL